MGIEQNDHIEIIDNENPKITEKLDKKEELIALGVLSVIDSSIQKYDLDLAVDRNNMNFYFVSGEHSLNIPMRIQDIQVLGNTLKDILNAEGHMFSDEINNLSLRATSQTDRQIHVNDSFGSSASDTVVLGKSMETGGVEGFEKGKPVFVNQQEIVEQNNWVEEIYQFAMNVKGVPMEEWDIEKVCNGPINNDCKTTLGFEENTEVNAKLKEVNQ